MNAPADEAHNRYPGVWESYLGVVALVVSLAVLMSYGFSLALRLTSVGAIALIAVIHLVWGRKVIIADRGSPRLLALELALFAVAVIAVPVANWLLFAIIPLIFQMVRLREAAVAVVAVNLVPPVVDLFLRPQQVVMDLIVATISAASGIWLGFFITRVIQQWVVGSLERLSPSSRVRVRVRRRALPQRASCRPCDRFASPLAMDFSLGGR